MNNTIGEIMSNEEKLLIYKNDLLQNETELSEVATIIQFHIKMLGEYSNLMHHHVFEIKSINRLIEEIIDEGNVDE